MNKNKPNWITHALAQGRTNATWQDALNATQTSPEDQSETEYILAIGKIVHSRLRQGREIESLTTILNCQIESLVVAKEFASSSPALVLKALLEDWSLREIRNAVCKSENCVEQF